MALPIHYFNAEKITTTDRFFEGYIVAKDEIFERIKTFKLPTQMSELNARITDTFGIEETRPTFTCFRTALTGAAISRFYSAYTEYTSESQEDYFPYLAYILLKLQNADEDHLQRASAKLIQATEIIFRGYNGKAQSLVAEIAKELHKLGTKA